ncbi:hypothetical protein BZA77DRAFT_302801 [Pyronema omphalodes]|nr:hypothetical protein BZA77DRAFT_302801 [Pyronema omphalodes]
MLLKGCQEQKKQKRKTKTEKLPYHHLMNVFFFFLSRLELNYLNKHLSCVYFFPSLFFFSAVFYICLQCVVDVLRYLMLRMMMMLLLLDVVLSCRAFFVSLFRFLVS